LLPQTANWIAAARDEWVATNEKLYWMSTAASVGMKPIVLSIQRISPLLAILEAHRHMPELHFA
jgi:hypothetical protein